MLVNPHDNCAYAVIIYTKKSCHQELLRIYSSKGAADNFATSVPVLNRWDRWDQAKRDKKEVLVVPMPLHHNGDHTVAEVLAEQALMAAGTDGERFDTSAE